jgi:hypothetical protein
MAQAVPAGAITPPVPEAISKFVASSRRSEASSMLPYAVGFCLMGKLTRPDNKTRVGNALTPQAPGEEAG